jgi:hypothetical protein
MVHRPNLERLNFERLNFEWLNFERLNLERTNFQRLNLERLNSVRPNFKQRNLERLNFERLNLERLNSKDHQLRTTELRIGLNLENGLIVLYILFSNNLYCIHRYFYWSFQLFLLYIIMKLKLICVKSDKFVYVCIYLYINIFQSSKFIFKMHDFSSHIFLLK